MDLAVPVWLSDAANRALGFLMQITDPATGRAPLFGTNDGANVLPVADGDFLDLRPTIQMLAATFRRELPLADGAWDEAAAWLVGSIDELPRIPWPDHPALWHAPAGGYAQLTTGTNRLFLRCPVEFRHRPAQADMLHADVWLGGRPFAIDGGSFSYNSRERFTSLASAAQHNGLTVDRIEPMQKFSRFLYLPWPTGRAELMKMDGIRASHSGDDRLGVKWWREVGVRPDGGFLVRDKVSGAHGRDVIWHWRMADRDWQLHPGFVKSAAAGSADMLRWSGVVGAHVSIKRSDPESAYGWVSLCYGEVVSTCSLILEVRADGDLELLFEFIPAT